MRTWLLIAPFSLALAAGAAHGQNVPSTGRGGAASPPKASEGSLSPAEAQKLAAQYLADCINDWDKGSHMSKQDWTRTCRRVVQRRIDYMLQQEK